ncbi:receptor-type tyrosine-protein phosphatase epsilon-like [Diadema antillarum]|uniref:receptor-type tyrosine-protein phosphatase epsilon-like n=1 Tax=Diadema antillarum TaxID=105358 RepID=UPI003A83E96C
MQCTYYIDNEYLIPIAPGRPVGVIVVETASLRLTFSWEKPRCGERHGPITHYEYALTDTASGVVVEQRNASVEPTQEVTTLRIQQLKAFHSYSFKVRACNFDICGSYSPETTRRTKKPKSPGLPTNVTVLSVTETEAIVTWQRPNPQYFTITGYNLTYEAIGWQDKDQPRLTINVACEVLCQEIRALADTNEGSPSDPIVWTTLHLTNMSDDRSSQPSFSSCESLDGKQASTAPGTAGTSIYENVMTESNKPQPIPVGELGHYLSEKNSGGLFDLKAEYQSLPSEQLHPWDVAAKEENRTKNRFINILPYDHSRVELTPKEGDPSSDYINASFIDGYKSPGKFIAAQGPNVASLEDFWRMIWQYGCGKIVMLTNLVEGKKKKCEKYWPDEAMTYGNIHVVLVKAEIHPDYAVRTFNVTRDDIQRELVQYHYTAWPDMAVPEYTAPLMTFIQVTRRLDRIPTVVHCSAGVGRTGTYITLDAMLDQVKHERKVDAYNFVSGLRQCRFKMVQVVEQYKFIYNALLESQTCGDTRIYPDAFPARYAELIATDPRTGSCPMAQEFRLLDAFSVHPKKTETIGARSQLNSMKNRYKNKLPIDRMRPYLMTQIDGCTDYINASFLPGFKHKNEFIGTQTPLPETVVDLWRLVVDYKVTCILMLHGSSKDKSFASYFPEKGSQKYGPYTATLLSKENLNHITCRSIQVVKDDSKKVHEVHQLQLKSCPVQAELPSSIQDVLELYEQLTKARCSEEDGDSPGPVLVHCRDGEGVTGMVCALFAVLERLKAERVVDVFQACKRLRAIRPGAVTMKQYEFIYKAARTQLDSDSIYQNV